MSERFTAGELEEALFMTVVDAITVAVSAGMKPSRAVCTAVSAAADVVRVAGQGQVGLDKLADVVRTRAELPCALQANDDTIGPTMGSA